ncbi:hypothetical protein [Streptomyces sp. GbtcB6]|uniref:hypothetical protein n=1 Tax=Streptomyces sp. GbtcB6 TaxID=2824751 RepID=UPI001C2F2F6E|nr:hypothetical protein [Streptomyces sp. GbtcB6]
MGERHSDDVGRGRRRAHPGGKAPGPGSGPAGPQLEALLATVIREDDVDTEGERRALAAFRTARDTGAHRARPRRRDDWRPAGTTAT